MSNGMLPNALFSTMRLSVGSEPLSPPTKPFADITRIPPDLSLSFSAPVVPLPRALFSCRVTCCVPTTAKPMPAVGGTAVFSPVQVSPGQLIVNRLRDQIYQLRRRVSGQSASGSHRAALWSRLQRPRLE